METYSSARRRASSSARSMSARARGSSESWPPWILARASQHRPQLHGHAGRVGAELAQRHGRDALGVLEQGGQDVLDIEHGAVGARGQLLRGEDGLLGLLGVAVELHGDGVPVV